MESAGGSGDTVIATVSSSNSYTFPWNVKYAAGFGIMYTNASSNQCSVNIICGSITSGKTITIYGGLAVTHIYLSGSLSAGTRAIFIGVKA